MVPPGWQTPQSSSSVLQVPVPLGALADLLGGAFFPGLYLVGGKPGVGKTQLGLQLAIHAALCNYKSLVVSSQIYPKEGALRTAAVLARKPWSTLHDASIESLERYLDRMFGLPFELMPWLEGQKELFDVTAESLQAGIQIVIMDDAIVSSESLQKLRRLALHSQVVLVVLPMGFLYRDEIKDSDLQLLTIADVAWRLQEPVADTRITLDLVKNRRGLLGSKTVYFNGGCFSDKQNFDTESYDRSAQDKVPVAEL